MKLKSKLILPIIILSCFFIGMVKAEYVEHPITNITVVSGTYVLGDLLSLQEVDGDLYTINEILGVNPLSVEFEINTSIPNAVNHIIKVYCRYEGNPAHEINLDVFNWTSKSWFTVIQLTEHEFEWNNYSVPIRHDDFVNVTTIRGRINHISNGANGHFLDIDYIRIWEFVDRGGIHWTTLLIIGIIVLIGVISFGR